MARAPREHGVSHDAQAASVGEEDGPAEETGLLPAMDEWMRRTALAQIAAWRDMPALGTLGRVPVVVITGEDDRLIPAAKAAALAAAIPGARLVRVPGTGHAVILEQPDAVTSEIAGLVGVAR